ncbi:MAG: hypothetical protein HF975_04455 [ANME-2 cluster archaeon]|nr:hypothetical protein [ANME-2 cluster archaeon]
MDPTPYLLTSLQFLIGFLGLSIGYHMSREFRDIETHIGEPGFTPWFIGALKKATQLHDLGLLGTILALSIYIPENPLTRTNSAIFLFFMFLAAYWDDRADAPPKDLINFSLDLLKKLLTGKLLWKP